MRTAFITNPELPIASVPHMATGGKFFLVGATAAPFLVGDLTSPAIPGSPSLSSLQELVWSQEPGPTADLSVCRQNLDGTELVELAGMTPFQNADAHPAWHPDGLKVVYIKIPSVFGDPYEVRSVDRDGANDTLLYTGGSGEFITVCSYSPSGDYIMFNLFHAAANIWVMEADGSNPTLVRVSPYQLAWDEINTPAWQHGADVLGFARYEDESNPILWQTVNPDGTGLTTIYTDSAREVWGTSQLAWLSDDSAMVSKKRLDGSTVFDASQARMVTVDGGGGGITEIIGSAHDLHGWGKWYVPICADDTVYETGWTDDVGPRIWFAPTINGDAGVASVLEDGSAYRVEHDMNATGEGWEGFEWVGTH